MKKINSVQEWLPYEEMLEDGIVKLKNKSFIKILKITPINFNLKSNLEKEAVLNSYKIFLKTCNFDMQILIQSNKEDLSKHVSKIQEINKQEEPNLIEISKQYLDYIQKLNQDKKSSSKNFYIILKETIDNKKELNNNSEKIIFDKLNDNYFKVKECLSRSGNIVMNISSKEEIEKIFEGFLNLRKQEIGSEK